jgi:ribosomal protein S18 acetylase RimI-like enzyme
MSDVTLVPLDTAEPRLVEDLLNDELLAWKSELGWDYRDVQQILLSFINRKALPGYLAIEDRRPVGYAYFLAHAAKGVIGTVYCNGSRIPRKVVAGLLEAVVSTLRKNVFLQRIEAQVMPFHGVDLAEPFLQLGFCIYPRQFLELDLELFPSRREPGAEEEIVPWSPIHISGAARVAWLGYRSQVDARVCEDYGTESGCEGYLRSVVETPGCGIFLPEASYSALDSRGMVCGFITVSRVSPTGAMIPQISILPSHQGRGLGRALMARALSALAAQGCKTVGLTVTVENRRAIEWYKREGFRLRKEFGAYVWQRP